MFSMLCPAVHGILQDGGNIPYCCPCKAATGHMWLLSTCNIATATEELTFHLYLILISLNVDSYVHHLDTLYGDAIPYNES